MVFELVVGSKNKRRPSMSPESMVFKQKKRVKNSRNKYLKPGALARIRDNRTATRSCTDIGKKRVVVVDAKEEKPDVFNKVEVVVNGSTPAATPSRIIQIPEGPEDETKQQMLPATPKTPEAGFGTQSRLESLPIDILVKILCHLHHDQLRAVFHVSQRIRTAVLLARQLYFNYTTPDRSRQEMLRTKTPLPTEHWPFIRKQDGKGIWISSPRTPKAPKQGPRPTHLYKLDMKQIAAVLFRETTFPSKCIVPPGLPRPVLKPVASNRVLFCEDELCQAVAQNKLH